MQERLTPRDLLAAAVALVAGAATGIFLAGYASGLTHWHVVIRLRRTLTLLRRLVLGRRPTEQEVADVAHRWQGVPEDYR